MQYPPTHAPPPRPVFERPQKTTTTVFGRFFEANNVITIFVFLASVPWAFHGVKALYIYYIPFYMLKMSKILIFALVIFVCFLENQAFTFNGWGISRATQLKKSLRMAIEVQMPALSSTMKEGKIVSWLKKPGDKVEVGDVVMVVESDKADMDVEAYEAGWLAKIITPEGGSAAVGSAVALLASSQTEIASVAAGGGSTSIASAGAPAPAAPAASSSSVPTTAVNMPALSSTMKEGKIVSWAKKVGDKGTVVFEKSVIF